MSEELKEWVRLLMNNIEERMGEWIERFRKADMDMLNKITELEKSMGDINIKESVVMYDLGNAIKELQDFNSNPPRLANFPSVSKCEAVEGKTEREYFELIDKFLDDLNRLRNIFDVQDCIIKWMLIKKNG